MDSRILIEFGLGVMVASICVVIQGIVLLALFFLLKKYFEHIEDRFNLSRNLAIVVGVVWVLGIMHLAQVAVWGVAYRCLGCFGSFYQALYFSLVTYSTVGYGDLVAPDAWKLFGGVEALMGMLMFGWSASFLFSTVSQFYKFRMRGHEQGGN